jgi:hypothetical protein
MDEQKDGGQMATVVSCASGTPWGALTFRT